MANTPLKLFKELQKSRESYVRQTVQECEEARLAYINEQLNMIRTEIYRFHEMKYEELQA